jgi:PAS domain S-box-containing protein
MREAAERFRFLAESMPQKIFTARPNGEADYFNQQWMKFAGLPLSTLAEWGWTEMMHPEDFEEFVRNWNYSVETGEPFEMEHRARRNDGEYRWHLTRACVMRDDNKKVMMWIGSNTDIHEQKLALEALEIARVKLETALEAGAIATWTYDIASNRLVADKNMAAAVFHFTCRRGGLSG